MMDGQEKSDSGIVAAKPTNKAGQPAAEPVEPRPETKGERGTATHAPGTVKMAFDYDILVIGGSTNGCGVARDAAGRGYKVLLTEMNDLASGTSSASTKLIHGGAPHHLLACMG